MICGHGFNDNERATIGKSEVSVPHFAWKILVIVKKGQPISASSRVVAIRMPNISTVSKKRWQEFLVTPAELEVATGLRFFGGLKAPIRAALLAKKDEG